MGILAEVHELDDRAPLAKLRAREDELELARRDLHPRRRPLFRLRERRSDGDRREHERERSHLSSAGRENDAAPGMTAAASVPSHCSRIAL